MQCVVTVFIFLAQHILQWGSFLFFNTQHLYLFFNMLKYNTQS